MMRVTYQQSNKAIQQCEEAYAMRKIKGRLIRIKPSTRSNALKISGFFINLNFWIDLMSPISNKMEEMNKDSEICDPS